MQLIPHGWNTAIGLSADCQLASALQQTDRVEYITGSPLSTTFVAEPRVMDEDGMLAIPATAGLTPRWTRRRSCGTPMASHRSSYDRGSLGPSRRDGGKAMSRSGINASRPASRAAAITWAIVRSVRNR